MKFASRTSWALPLLVALLASVTGFAGETSTPDAAALAPESAAVSPDALHAHLRDAWADQSASGPQLADELPAAPDSATLCLTALAGIGVWHLGRSVRKADYSALPEWYHTNAPRQIGYATPFELDCRLAPSRTDVALRPEPPQADSALLLWALDPQATLKPLLVLSSTADPRGPPAHA